MNGMLANGHAKSGSGRISWKWDALIALGFLSLAVFKLMFIRTVSVWPSVGVVFAAAMLVGDRSWRGVFVGSFSANLVWAFANDVSFSPLANLLANVGIAAGIAAGNALAGVLGARALRLSIKKADPFGSPLDALRFCVVGAGTFALVTTFTGGTVNQLWNAPNAMKDWLISDYCGVIIIAPVILLWLRPDGRALNRAEAWEMAGITLVTVGLALLLFGPRYSSLPLSLHMASWLLIPMIWAAVRFRQEMSATILAICFIIIWAGTAAGYGPFAERGDPKEALRQAVMFSGIVGVILLIVGAIYNENKQAMVALRQSEEQFQKVFQHSEIGMVIVELDGRFRMVNQAFARMVGYSAEELQQMRFTDMTHEDDQEMCLAEIKLLVEGKKNPLQLEKRYIRKDGGIMWADVVGSVIRDPRGRASYLVGQVQDISERKRTEEALRKSELKFRTLVEQSLVGVYIIQDDRFVYVNRRAAEMYGYAEEELLAMPSAMGGVVMPEDLPLVQEHFRRRYSGETNEAHYSFRGRHKSGAVMIVEVHGVLIDYGGRPTLIGTVLDVTEQKRSEEALHTLSARLLQLQDDERRRIARDLHDTTAQGLAALAMNLVLLRNVDANQRERLEKITTESLALAERSIQEIRTLSYLLHPPELEAVGLPGAIREYAAGFARRSGMEVAVEATAQVGRMSRETELALFRIVQECLGNIRRHAHSNMATIRLGRKDQMVILEIQDAGRGIPADRLAQINTGRGEMGVGIAGMRERLHQLKGRLEIESSPKGTTMRAMVPLSGTAI